MGVGLVVAAVVRFVWPFLRWKLLGPPQGQRDSTALLRTAMLIRR